MNILIKLNSGQGVSLGPDFTLAANFGLVSPNTATLDELLVGKLVSVDNAATQVTVLSNGLCENALIIPITTTTSTTTSTTTTTTTTISVECDLGSGTVNVSPYLYFPSSFAFVHTGESGWTCQVATSPCYGPPNPTDPVLGIPLNLYSNIDGVPFADVIYVVDRRFGYGSFPAAIYAYDSATGAVGAYIGTCLGG